MLNSGNEILSPFICFSNFGIEFAIKVLFENPTIEDIADKINYMYAEDLSDEMNELFSNGKN